MAGKKEQSDAAKSTRFDGSRSNRNTKSNNKVRIQKSKLRDTAAKLRELETKCLENIKLSVEGSLDVKDKQLDSSKWVISSIIALDRAAAQEEASLTKIRLEGKRDTDEDDEQEIAEIVKLVPRISPWVADSTDKE